MYSIIFIVLASICKAIKDTLDFHYNTSIFSNCNARYFYPTISWQNKYKEDLKTPKFFGSTTFLVFLTDAWHLFDFLQTIFFIVAIVVYSKIVFCIVDIYILYCIFSICFELFYRIFGMKKQSIIFFSYIVEFFLCIVQYRMIL